jgi:hypothetical protein
VCTATTILGTSTAAHAQPHLSLASKRFWKVTGLSDTLCHAQMRLHDSRQAAAAAACTPGQLRACDCATRLCTMQPSQVSETSTLKTPEHCILSRPKHLPGCAAVLGGQSLGGAEGQLLDAGSRLSRRRCKCLTEGLSLAAALGGCLCLSQDVGHRAATTGGDSSSDSRCKGLGLATTRSQGLQATATSVGVWGGRQRSTGQADLVKVHV